MHATTRSDRRKWRAPIAWLIAMMVVATGLGIAPAGAAISHVVPAVTAHNITTGTRSLTLTAPALAAGDLLIAQVTVTTDVPTGALICAPTGWTAVGARLNHGNPGDSTHRVV